MGTTREVRKVDARGHTRWLFWQVAGLGPMAGQLIFFS